MSVTIYVLYSDFGNYEGCSSPEDVVLSETEAQKWVEKDPYSNTYSEFEIEVEDK